MAAEDFYRKVPKDRDENLAYRMELRKRCKSDAKVRKAVESACRDDILYFFNALCILFEPRPMFYEKDGIRRKLPMIIPFITWPHQDEAIRQIYENLGYEDVCCVGEGTLIVTDKGLIPIEKVTPCHLVFDGVEFVHSEGAAFQGVKQVIDAYGMDLTPDHQVLTVDGWADAEKRLRRQEVGHAALHELCRRRKVSLDVRLWRGANCNIWGRKQSGSCRRYTSLQQEVSIGKKSSRNSRLRRDTILSDMVRYAAALPKPTQPRLRSLRRSRHKSMQKVGRFRGFQGGHARVVQAWTHARADQQRRELLSRELHLGRPQGTGIESQEQPLRRSKWREIARSRGSSSCWDQRIKHKRANREGHGFVSSAYSTEGLRYIARANDDCRDGKDSGSLTQDNACQNTQLWSSSGALARASKTARTYDIVNCGPRSRFVAVGRDGRMVILHNCVKSRGEGMSWMAVLMAVHDWLFLDNCKIGFVSRTESAADDPEDSDSLFWKVDFELTKLPSWMAGRRGVDWKRNISNHTLTNLRNGARITAGAATGDVFRGGRLTWALMDEFAFFKKGEDADALNSSHGATNSRLFVSTVNGQNNEFFRIVHEPSSQVPVIIDWKQNISRNRGLYRFVKGVPVAVDPVNNPLPDNYNPPTQEILDVFARLRRKGFRLEGDHRTGDGDDNAPLRSPWYDHECDRPGMTPQRIAQELDMDFAGSEYLVFGNEFNSLVAKHVMPPVHIGRFDVFEETEDGELDYSVLFNSTFDGNVKLWMPLDVRGRPPKSNYALGADVCTGLGGSYTSNSTLVGFDLLTKEQVFAFASNTIEPGDFADLAVGVANWMWGAYLGWEHNGPGAAFTKRILKLHYGNVYRRKSQTKKSKRETKELGWWTDEKTKSAMFSEISRAVQKGDCVVRDEALAKEFKQYVYLNGKIEHAASLTTDDGSSKGKAHGDRVIALGVVLQCALDRPQVSQFLNGVRGEGTGNNSGRMLPDTMAYRMKIADEEEASRRRDGLDWRDSVLESLSARKY